MATSATTLRRRKELRIVVDVTIRGDDHRFQAQVKPDLLIDDWQMLDIFFYQERNKVAMGTIFGNGDRCGFASFGQGTAPVDIQGCIHLGKRKVGSIPGKSIRGIGSRLHAMLFLEGWILSSALQEVAKGTFQMPQSLLQGNTRYLTEPSRLFLLFEVSQHDCQLMVVKALAMLEESIGTLSQCPVVDKATTAKGTSKHACLLIGGIYSVFVCFLLFHALHGSICYVNYQQGTALSSPSLKDKGSSRADLIEATIVIILHHIFVKNTGVF